MLDAENTRFRLELIWIALPVIPGMAGQYLYRWQGFANAWSDVEPENLEPCAKLVFDGITLGDYAVPDTIANRLAVGLPPRE